MSDWEGPRLARQQEFAEAMAFTDLVFRPGQRGRRILQRQYPHAYREGPAGARRLLLLRHRGDLVGCLAIHPMMLRLGAARVSAGGIGIVGTHPERRGEGIMTTLLNDALQRMEQAGYAVSVLGGDRQRYARFGWQDGGVRQSFEVTARSLGPPSKAERGLRLVRITQRAGASVFRRIQRLCAQRPYGVERPLRDVAPLVIRNGREAYTAEAGRRFAYVVVAGPNRLRRPFVSVDEFGGDTDLVQAMLRRLLGKAAGGVLQVIVGPNPADVELIQPVSASWRRSCDGMINILSLPRLARQLEPELRRRAAEQNVQGRFHLRAASRTAAAPVDPGACEIRLGGQAPGHRLRPPADRLVDLLFGCLPLRECLEPTRGRMTAAALQSLERILPLPLHVPPLNHI